MVFLLSHPPSFLIKITDEQSAHLVKRAQEPSAMSLSERILIQSALEKDRVSLLQTEKGKMDQISSAPKHAHECDLCPKSFKKPSDLVR